MALFSCFALILVNLVFQIGLISSQQFLFSPTASILPLALQFPAPPKTKLLDEACDSNLQCKSSYAGCINGKCSCYDGFAPQSGECLPRKIACQSGHPQMFQDGSAVVRCATKYAFQSALAQNSVEPLADAVITGTGLPIEPLPEQVLSSKKLVRQDVGCAAGYSCVVPPNTNLLDTDSEELPGFCCPLIEAKCHFGLPNTSASCAFQNTSLSGDQFCDLETHYCVGVAANSDGVCCPKPCTGQDVYKNGKCYQRNSVQINEVCEVSEQCFTLNATCTEGRCSCPGGTFLHIFACLDASQSTEVYVLEKEREHRSTGFYSGFQQQLPLSPAALYPQWLTSSSVVSSSIYQPLVASQSDFISHRTNQERFGEQQQRIPV